MDLRARTAAALISLMMALLTSGCGAPSAEPPKQEYLTLPDSLLFSLRIPKAIVEIDFVEPHRLTQGAIAQIRADLQKYAGKSEVVILEPTPIPPQGSFISSKRLYEIHEATADVAKPHLFWQNDSALLHILVLEGDFERPAMGYFAGSGVIALFPKYFDQTKLMGATVYNSGYGYHREGMEKLVLRHEMGHAYGLVNCGIDMVKARENRSSPCHSSQSKSIMGGHSSPELADDPARWAEWFQNGEPVTYDADDLADIAAWKKRDPGPRAA